MTATTDQPNHQYNVMWLTWTNQQYYLLQRTLFSHFTNTLRQFLWNVLHFVFQFIHIFWHWKQKEIADLTFYSNAQKEHSLVFHEKGRIYAPGKTEKMYFDFSEVIWLFLYPKEICEKTTVFGNQSSKFMYRKYKVMFKKINRRNERSTHMMFWTF